MRHTHDILRNRLLADVLHRPVSLKELRVTQWSPHFEQLMRNRLVFGTFRYGFLNDPHKRQWDRISGMRKRICQYDETGNTECLVDIANMALLEFEEGKHPMKHFSAMVDDHTCL